jgi:hypothetical protein
VTTRRAALWMLLATVVLNYPTWAQSSPTTNILSRMAMVESRYGRGSAFSIDIDQREYWITAKHILTGATHPPYGSVESNSASIRILDPGSEQERWLPIDFTVIDAGNDIDIVALAPPRPLLENPIPSLPPDSRVTLGAECEFLGFPFGGGWRAKFADGKGYWLPYVKRCTVSALTTEGQKIFVLDGINNAGFSGGPVIYHTGADQKVVAVISGYVKEPAEVISSVLRKRAGVKRKTPDAAHTAVNVNSGFIIAYDISAIIDAIHQKPAGQLRGAAKTP